MLHELSYKLISLLYLNKVIILKFTATKLLLTCLSIKENNLKKIIFIILGCLTFGLGTIGIFLPFLPTTVFYLLTAFFWLRSSEKLYQKFVDSKFYAEHIDRTLVRKEITTAGMVRMFIMMFVVFLIPCLLVDNVVMRVTMATVYVAHVIGLTWYFKFSGRKRSKGTAKAEAEVEVFD